MTNENDGFGKTFERTKVHYFPTSRTSYCDYFEDYGR